MSDDMGRFPRGFSRATRFPWPLVRADKLVELQYGKALPENRRSPGSVPVYGTNGRCGWHDEALHRGPGVILGRKGMGPLGVEWSASDYWVIDTAYSVRQLVPDLDLRFFYYLVKYTGLNHLKDGTSNPSLTRDSFGSQLLPFPPHAEQRRIAASLAKLDDKIDVDRRIAETLEEIARTLFKSWFVEFDPVRGSVTLPDDIQALFPDRLVDSPLGPVPDGWGVAQLGSVASINQRTLKAKELPESVLYVDISSANGGVAHATDLPREQAPSRARRGVQHGDTVVSTVRPERGAHFLALHPPERLIVSTGFATLTPTSVPWSFLYSAVCRPEVFERLGALASGAAYPAIRPATIAGLPVVLPPQNLSEAYHTIAAPLLERVGLATEESSTLGELGDSLLPKLISGEIRLGAA
jgi:type I restriction enzyme S subunit